MTQFSSLYGTRLDRELGSADSTQLFTTARRKAAINEGLQQFADLTECYRRTSTLAWTSGTEAVTLGSSDFVRPVADGIAVRYTDSNGTVTMQRGDDLPRVDRTWMARYRPDWLDSTVSTGTLRLPEAHYLDSDGGAYRLGLVPAPSAGSTNASLAVQVPYIARPRVMSSNTDEPMTDSNGVTRDDLRMYHQAFVHYGAAQLEKYRRDVEASGLQMQAFMGYVERYKAQMKRKGGQAIAIATSYFRRTGR